MINVKRAAAIAAALAGLVLLSAGSCDTDDPHADAPEPTPGQVSRLTKVRVFQQPDGFRNIITGCDGSTGIYETSRGGTGSVSEGTSSALAVVPNDPHCVG